MAKSDSILTNPIFHDEDKARKYLESQRWPRGSACPHCGEAKDWRKLEGEKHRQVAVFYLGFRVFGAS